MRRSFVKCFAAVSVCLAVGGIDPRVFAGTDANGFFDEYLTAVGYNGPGCNPGDTGRVADYLCDGFVNEASLTPSEGFDLGPPVVDAMDCTGLDAPSLTGFHLNAILGLDGNLPIARTLTAGDTLDFDALSTGADNAMAYAWVYVDNVSGAPLSLVMGVSSDDTISVEQNGVEVYSNNICRGFGNPAQVQDRFLVTLPRGGSLFQFKVFDGCCGWGMRARFEAADGCLPILSGGGDIVVGTDPIPLFSTPATRAISTAGTPPAMVTANITVTVANGGSPYTLEERFDSGWAASMVSPAATASSPGVLRWVGITAPVVTYRLTRSGDYSSPQGRVSGTVSLGVDISTVGGATQIPGGLPVYVAEVLVTPSYIIADPLTGCTVGTAEIDGAWINDGDTLTDASIVPFEGMEFSVDYLGASQAGGLDTISLTAEGRFLATPGDPLSNSLLVRVASGDGFYDWQRADIYEADVDGTMNVAYFYAINSSGTARRVILGFGSDDSGGVRVNGRPVHTAPACRGHPGFADKFFAVLDPGKNLVAVYTFEAGGGYNMCIRFEDENFEPIALRTTLDPTGYDPEAHPDPGPLPSLGVSAVLVTASFTIGAGLNGCTVTDTAIRGDWITGMDGDGNPVTDANIVPREGLVLRPDYNGAARSSGLTDIDDGAETRYWTVPGNLSASGSILVRVTGASGFYDWQRGDIYAGDPDVTMNVAYFYALNDTAAPQCLQMGFGSDDSGGVRVNGRPAHAISACRGHPGFTDKFLVQLDPGKNLVAVYTYENGGGYNMCIRFEEPVTGRPVIVATTTDPSGYNPAAHPEPDPLCVSGGIAPAPYIRDGLGKGLITQYLVPRNVIDQSLNNSGATNSGAFPEDYISVDGGPADVDTIFEGAIVAAGTTGTITTGVRGSPCGTTTLAFFDGFVDGAPSDPSLFNGELYYGNPDLYSSSLFCFVNNISGGELDGYFAFDSDDGGSLYVNGQLAVEFTPARGYAGANTLQTFAMAPAVLDVGPNLVQLSYLEGIGGSGARLGLFTSPCFDTAFSDTQVEVSANPPGYTPPAVTAARTIGRLDCDGNASVTITFGVGAGGMAAARLREELPMDAVGSAASLGSFDPTGSVLTLNGMVADGQSLTYRVSGADPGDAYCFSTINDLPVVGDSVFVRGTDVCDDLVDGEIYLNCGGGEFTDAAGRVWLEDSFANPSRFLTSPNRNVATFGCLIGVDTFTDPLTATEGFEGDIFLDERWDDGDVEYAFSGLPRGDYEVILLFMEGCCSDGCEDIADPQLSVGGCRVFDVFINDDLRADQFSQNVAAARLLGIAPGGGANCTAVTQVHEVTNVDSIRIRLDDLGGGNPPENAAIKAICIRFTGVSGTFFVRGDADSNNRIELTDGIRILNFLFTGVGAPPVCFDASDTDDNGRLELTDAVRVLNYLFTGVGAPPAVPRPSNALYVTADCGLDVALEDPDLGCVTPSSTCAR